MADYRRKHRLHYARMNIGGAGSEQHARGRLQLRKRSHVKFLSSSVQRTSVASRISSGDALGIIKLQSPWRESSRLALSVLNWWAMLTASHSPVDSRLIAELREIAGADAVTSRATELKVYECDGWTLEKTAPDLLVRPRTTAEVSAILKLLHRRKLAFVPRGAGTGLSGGCLPVKAPVMICTSRMNRVLAVDLANRRIEVESGVVNLHVTNAVKAEGYFYPPDPSSQAACTIGGNIAENSGGPHTLKYGVTTNHVLGLELVLPDGEVAELGSPVDERCGYDLVGAVVGAEGTAGIVTRAMLRLMREPEAHRTLLVVFDDVQGATRAVSAIIAAGIIPGAIEMMDQMIIRAVEAAFHVGLPEDAGAVLIVELDGISAAMEEQGQRLSEIILRAGARTVRVARDKGERATLWKARKRAFGAVGRLAPNYATQDGVVPRTDCPTSCARFLLSAAAINSGLAMFSMPATAIFIQSCCTTNVIHPRCAGRSRPAATFSRHASRWAAA